MSTAVGLFPQLLEPTACNVASLGARNPAGYLPIVGVEEALSLAAVTF